MKKNKWMLGLACSLAITFASLQTVNAAEQDAKIVVRQNIHEEMKLAKKTKPVSLNFTELKNGKVQEDHKKLYLEVNGKRIEEEGWYRMDGEEYYVSKDSSLLQDHFLIYTSSQIYYFTKEGHRAKGIVPVGIGYMHFDSLSGELVQEPGLIKVENKTFSTDEKGLVAQNTWVKLAENDYYFFDNNGILLKGQDYLEHDGKIYRLEENGRRVTEFGPFTYLDKIYFSDSKGEPYINEVVFSNKGNYVLGEDGVALSGKVELNGVNYDCDPSKGQVLSDDFLWPVPSSHRITSDFGPRPEMGDFHNGIDIGGNDQCDIVASLPGKVIHADWYDSGGQAVIIQHPNGFVTMYYHLAAYNVVKGDEVNAGDVIGFMGSTGYSTGTHLHFEVRLGSPNGSVVNPNSLSYITVEEN